MSRRVLLVVLALCSSQVALAQQISPEHVFAPTRAQDAVADEDSPDRTASTLYEEAVRAESLGKRLVAQQLAQQALDASPHGRYSPALHRLLDRLTSQTLVEEPARNEEAPLGSRVGYVVSGGLIGAFAGTLLGAAASNISGSGIAGAGLAGTLLGAAVTAASLTAVHDGSMPAHLWSWGMLGAFLATGAFLLDAPNPSGSVGAGLIGAGLLAGAVVGGVLGATTSLTTGDGIAALILGTQLTTVVLLFEGSDIVATNPSSNTVSQVVGGTLLALSIVGFIGGELLNHSIHWSGGRWGLIFLSAVLGAGVAGLIAGLASAGASTAIGLVAGGDAVGFALGCVATMGMSPDDSRAAPSPSGDVQRTALPVTRHPGLAWTF